MTNGFGTGRSVAGAVALVTGAASGMGAATARLLAAEGARVAAFDRDERGLAAVVAEMEAADGAARGWTVDLADRAAVSGAVAEVAAHFGGIDIVVNNAGMLVMQPLDADDYDAVWDRTLAVNLTAMQCVIRAALPHLRHSKAGRIVNIASTEALGATPNKSAYTASKAGVVGLTRGMALDLGQEGITVNCICPGFIVTPMTAFYDEAQAQRYARSHTMLRRPGEPEEVAHVTLSLCLPAMSYVTGAVIPVDGGLVARNG